MSRARLLQSVALMMAATLVGKALLVLREPIVAAYFGASAQTDAYNVAMTIVTMFLTVTISPISAVLVPVYVERLHQERAAGLRFIRQVFTLYLLVVSTTLLVAYFAAPWLVRLYAPGFAAETELLAVRLTRILALFAVVTGVGSYLGMVLTAHQRFLWVALGPIVTAMLVIAILWVGAPRMGVDALAWGMVIGNTAELLLLGIATQRQAVGLGLDFRIGEAVRGLGRLSVWMLLGRFIGQGNDLVDRNMLSRLSEGSIAALGFARSIYLLPFEIFTTGITRVIIADFSWDVARGDTEALRRDLSLATRLAAFFMLPVTVGLIVLRLPIVQLLYERGAFDAADTQATAIALAFLSLSLYFRALTFIGARVFIARQQLVFPAIASALILIAHIGLNLALIPTWQLAGVAISLSVTEVFSTVVYFARLRQELGPLDGRRIVIALVKMGLAAGGMAALIVPLDAALYPLAAGTLLRIGVLLLMVGSGAAVYLGLLYLLRLEELRLALKMMRDLVRRENQRTPVATDFIQEDE
jgi:putative peptidoglycan lipid II flippase